MNFSKKIKGIKIIEFVLIKIAKKNNNTHLELYNFDISRIK